MTVMMHILRISEVVGKVRERGWGGVGEVATGGQGQEDKKSGAAGETEGEKPATRSRTQESTVINLSDIDVHGLGYIARGGGWVWRGFWILATVCLASFCAFLCFTLTKEYFARPTATLISFQQLSHIYFPKLKICPSYSDSIWTEKLVRDVGGEAERRELRESLHLQRNFVAYILASFGFARLQGYIYNWERNVTMMEKVQKLYSNIYSESGATNSREFMHIFYRKYAPNCSETLRQCKLGDQAFDCCTAFQAEYMGYGGLCWGAIEGAVSQAVAGAWGKLELYVKSPPSALQDNETQKLSICFGQYDLNPYCDSPLYIPPGSWMTYRVGGTYVNRLLDTNACGSQTLELMDRYSQSACSSEKVLQMAMARLNCSLPFAPRIPHNIGICAGETVVKHYKEIVRDATTSLVVTLKPVCLPACSRWQYTVQQIAETNPTAFRDKYGDKYDVYIAVFYPQLDYEKRQEILTISWAGYISQIGGQLGLALGCSLMTVVQLIMYLGGYLQRRVHRVKN